MNTARLFRISTSPASAADNRPAGLARQTIGAKGLMAASGGVLVGWTCLHLGGNLLALAGPELVNRYGRLLHDSPALWVQRAVLGAAILIHVVMALRTWRQSRRARGERPRYLGQPGGGPGTLSSRTMRLTGTLLLGLLILHVAHIYGLGHPSFVEGDVHHNLVAGLKPLGWAAIYALLSGLVGLHLGHGVKSALVTLGFAERSWPRGARRAARGLPVGMALGFALLVVWAVVVG